MKKTILCVDDEQMILDSLSLTLGREYKVITASSGAQGLQELKNHPEIGVVLSDMRMPEMNGAEFLQRAFALSPNSTRMLLTGETDLNSAVKAVNEGKIFRFLKKPCPPPELLSAVLSAFEQHRLLTAEKELLEQTLLGSITMITEILGLISPSVFGRTSRIRNMVSAVAEKLELPDRWQVEVAASLSQLGLITLPHDTVEGICMGRESSMQEARQVEQLPKIAVDLIQHIPRLEGVREILQMSQKGCAQTVGLHSSDLSAQILKAACFYEKYTAAGSTPDEALARLSNLKAEIDAKIFEAMSSLASQEGAAGSEQVLPASSLRVNMIILEDIVLPNGSLFAPRGYHVTESLVHRIQNFGVGAFAKPVRVRIQALVRDAA